MKVRVIHSPGWMVLVGFVARVLYILIAHSYRLSVAYWSTFEMANLAYSLATGHGFSSPFGGDTGPSRELNFFSGCDAPRRKYSRIIGRTCFHQAPCQSIVRWGGS